MPTSKTTAKLKKIAFHEKTPTRKPARVGPTADADMMTKAFTPMAVPILCGGMTSKTIENISGKIRPVPTP